MIRSVKSLSQKSHINSILEKGLSEKFIIKRQVAVKKALKRVVSHMLLMDITREHLERPRDMTNH